jgi:SAM-dependent methyltransferase
MNRPLYDQLVRYYEVLEGRDWVSETNLIASVLEAHRCESVVDLGCGTGYHARSLAKLGFETTGVDISRQNIRFAKEKAMEEGAGVDFVVGSYYGYRPAKSPDAALCMNWSIPVKDGELRRFFDNTYSMLRPGGLLIFDYEKVDEIVWDDVGKPIFEWWNVEEELVVRVSVGVMESNVLSSRDVYAIYTKGYRSGLPDEKLRYKATAEANGVRMYKDHSFVRFFSPPEIRRLARASGFKVVANLVLPRKKYKRSYAVLEKIEGTRKPSQV